MPLELMFEPFQKIPRVAKNTVVISEKLDGTNGQIYIVHRVNYRMEVANYGHVKTFPEPVAVVGECVIFAGSRKRYVMPNDMVQDKNADNYGFASWVRRNAEDLVSLGEGRHYGEWYGIGINRGYDIDERRFALFNTERWGKHNPNTPSCCEVVPLLYKGPSYADTINNCMVDLALEGSVAVPGYMRPEGIIAYYPAIKSFLKQTFESPEGKWKEVVNEKTEICEG